MFVSPSEHFVTLNLDRVDCVGILKLRNADVEARIGVAGSKKKSTRARLAFRVNIPQPDGSVLTLQTTSSPILCSESTNYRPIHTNTNNWLPRQQYICMCLFDVH